MQKSIYYLLIFLAFFFSGCLVQDEPVASTPVPTTVEIQSTATKTDTPIPSATNTIQSPTPTSTDETTETPTLEPTWTPLPTLDPDGAKLEIARLMETNNNCQGPCFWGITSGVTDFEYAVQFLGTLKDTGIKEDDGIEYYNNYFLYDDASIYINLMFVNARQWHSTGSKYHSGWFTTSRCIQRRLACF